MMMIRATAATLALAVLPAVVAAQQTTPPPTTTPPTTAPAPAPMTMPAGAPVADAFRHFASEAGKNLMAAADEMPAAKYAYKPTPAQMSFGDIVVHLAQGNDYLCGTIAGTKAPERAKIAPAAGKAALVARLKETFQFCDQALAGIDDSKLADPITMFGQQMTRAGVIIVTVGDWADHYSQSAIYMRLNGLLPPTAKKRAAEPPAGQ